ncbi:MAG: ABC transporter permease [Lachnospiraceae bacterium]|nr:ABC transporter permease [Lachnospiraceae bacterium]
MKKRISRKKVIKIKFVIMAALALSVVFLTLFAGFIAKNDPYQTCAISIRTAPCVDYPFGTDNLGRCIFARVLYGGRTTIAATFAIVFISFAIGTVIGMVCGYFGGIIDRVLMRLADITLGFPQMVVAIAVAGILGGGIKSAMIALGITMWVSFARLARSHTFSIRSAAFVQTARFAGKNDAYIIMVHVFPNLLAPVLTNALTQIGTTMIGLSGLSFLGLGVIPPAAEWGAMISEARAYIQIAPWAVIYPSVATIITIIIFNYLGDVIMDYREVR